MNRRTFFLAAFAVLAALSAGIYLLPSPGQGVAAPAAPPVTFVGGTRCAACHEKQTALWRGSHHDLAMQSVGEKTVLGNFDDASFRYNGITSRFFRRDGKYVVRTDGPDGKLHDYEVAYVFGVTPLQQYLVALSEGRYQALSLAWDSRPREKGGQRWFHLYPGEGVDHRDVLHWTKLAQNWNTQCAECHSTNLRKGYDPVGGRFSTTFSEIDVSCEACHGPGSRHVEWAEKAKQRGREPRGDPGLIVSFQERRSRTWRMDVERGIAKPTQFLETRIEVETCARCHSRRGLLTEDYQPGRLLADTHHPSLLDRGLYHPDGQMLEEVYNWGSFLQSRMYAAGVTCSDCHDPHALKVRISADDVCSSCHQPERWATPKHHFHRARSKGASCVACHMRTETYMVVDARHDHSFRVPRPDLSVTLGVPNACNDCHKDRSARWAAQAVRRSYPKGRWGAPHYGEVLAAARRARPDAAAGLIRIALDPREPGIVRGTAVSELTTHPGAATRTALERAVADRDPLVRLGVARALEALEPPERLRAGAPLLWDPVRAVRVEAVASLADVPADTMTGAQRAAFDRALDEFFQAQRANAERPESHVNLGIVHAKRGRPAEARRAYEAALRLGPWFVPAYVNLADLLRLQGRDEEGEALLLRGIAAVPQDPSLHHALGLLLVRQKRLGEALAELQRAVERAPEDAGFAYAWALGLHSAGRTERALSVLRRAHETNPGSREILLALVAINQERGAYREALAWARRLDETSPADPAVRELATPLEQR